MNTKSIVICLAAALILALLAIGCSSDDLSTSGGTPPMPVFLAEQFGISDTSGYGVWRIFDYDTTLTFSVSERYLSSAQNELPVVFINQETDRIFSAYNCSILNEIETCPGFISFTNKGVVLPNLTLDALGPAHNRTYFNVPEGRYKLVFKNHGASDVYRMKVTTDFISIRPILSSFTRPTSELFWRFRANTFALYCGTPDSTSYLCDEFMDSLLAHLEIEEFTFPDTGVVGYGRNSYQYNATARYFSYEEATDFHEAGQILIDFVDAHQAEFHKVGMWIINWQQESYLSWRLPQ